MTLFLTNSMGGAKQPFVPACPREVRMSVTARSGDGGADIGDARCAVVFDVLDRVLERHFGRVIHARTLANGDDAAADLAALDLRPPRIKPKASDHMPQIIALIARLIGAGHASDVDGRVLYRITSFPDYGALSGRHRRAMAHDGRGATASPDPDAFVLWQSLNPGQSGWDSPWGRGRPGPHIACSALIEHHLGHPLDILGGCADLLYPHHENLIAQGTRAGFWLHTGPVVVDGAGHDLLARIPAEAVRLALLSAPYRRSLDWTARTLPQAVETLSRLYAVIGEGQGNTRLTRDSPILVPFRAALDDDLNTPAALAELFALAETTRRAAAEFRPRYIAALIEAGGELGLLQKTESQWRAECAGSRDGPVQDAVPDRVRKRRGTVRLDPMFEAGRIGQAGPYQTGP